MLEQIALDNLSIMSGVRCRFVFLLNYKQRIIYELAISPSLSLTLSRCRCLGWRTVFKGAFYYF